MFPRMHFHPSLTGLLGLGHSPCLQPPPPTWWLWHHSPLGPACFLACFFSPLFARSSFLPAWQAIPSLASVLGSLLCLCPLSWSISFTLKTCMAFSLLSCTSLPNPDLQCNISQRDPRDLPATTHPATQVRPLENINSSISPAPPISLLTTSCLTFCNISWDCSLLTIITATTLIQIIFTSSLAHECGFLPDGLFPESPCLPHPLTSCQVDLHDTRTWGPACLGPCWVSGFSLPFTECPPTCLQVSAQTLHLLKLPFSFLQPQLADSYSSFQFCLQSHVLCDALTVAFPPPGELSSLSWTSLYPVKFLSELSGPLSFLYWFLYPFPLRAESLCSRAQHSARHRTGVCLRDV